MYTLTPPVQACNFIGQDLVVFVYEAKCKGIEWLLHQSRGKGCRIATYAPCMLTQVLPLLVEQ